MLAAAEVDVGPTGLRKHDQLCGACRPVATLTGSSAPSLTKKIKADRTTVQSLEGKVLKFRRLAGTLWFR